MGRDPDCSPEVRGIVDFAARVVSRHRVTSTFRPGAVTVAGNPSRHGRKLAVDFAGPVPGRDTKELDDIFRAFLPVERHLNELIHSGPDVTFNIKSGRRVGRYAEAVHHDHVHVAVDPGMILSALLPAPVTPRPLGPAPADDDGREHMADPVDAIQAPGGGVWVLTRDGGVRAFDGAPFFGSYPGLPEADKQGGPRTFVEIRHNNLGGYDLVSSGDEVYTFSAGRRGRVPRQ